MGKLVFLLFFSMLLNSLKAASQLALKPHADSSYPSYTILRMPQKFYSQPLGYFCKKEVQLQKITTLPLFIRLGTKEYVDQLERKNGRVMTMKH